MLTVGLGLCVHTCRKIRGLLEHTIVHGYSCSMLVCGPSGSGKTWVCKQQQLFSLLNLWNVKNRTKFGWGKILGAESG